VVFFFTFVLEEFSVTWSGVLIAVLMTLHVSFCLRSCRTAITVATNTIVAPGVEIGIDRLNAVTGSIIVLDTPVRASHTHPPHACFTIYVVSSVWGGGRIDLCNY
jgi:hypothetical protein